MAKELDYMEYASDALAQAAYVSNDLGGKFNLAGFFNGSTSYISVPDHTDWFFDTGNFTIDFWVWFNSVNASIGFVQKQASNVYNMFYMATGSRLDFVAVNAGTQAGYAYNWSPATDTWYHLELGRDGTNLYLFIDGDLKTWSTISTPIASNSITDLAAPVWIGLGYGASDYLNGRVEEFRVSKGICRHTTSFTPETSPYSSDANTKLLLHLNGNVDDDGNTGHTPVNNDVTFPAILQCYSEAAIKQQGSYSLKTVAKITHSLNDTLTKTLAGADKIDLSGIDTLELYCYASRTGTNIEIQIHDSGGTTTTKSIVISSAGAWEQTAWDISGIADADKDDIDSIVIKITNADDENTFYVDDFYGVEIAAYPVAQLNKNRISGYHCFLDAYMRAKREGFIPLKLPDGTIF